MSKLKLVLLKTKGNKLFLMDETLEVFMLQLNNSVNGFKDREESSLPSQKLLIRENLRYVLVVKRIRKRNHVVYIRNFLNNLLEYGFYFDAAYSHINDHLLFIMIFATDNDLIKLSSKMNIGLTCHSYRFASRKPNYLLPCKVFNPNIEEAKKRRISAARNSSSEYITDAEGIIVTHHILEITKYGKYIEETGLDSLLDGGVLVAAYPLHQGSWKWSETGLITDRQLLKKYWADVGMFYKGQPMDIIEEYFGMEMSFYFAWLRFYTLMLIPLAILSVIVTIYGLATSWTILNMRSVEMCSMDHIVCPACYYKLCKYSLLYESCDFSHFAYVLDNDFTIAHACIATIWATLFTALWKREQALLQLQWNVTVPSKTSKPLRAQFLKKAEKRESTYTGLLTLYIPTTAQVLHVTITFVTIALLLTCIVAAMIAVIMFKLFLSHTLRFKTKPAIVVSTHKLFATVCGAALNALIIVLFGRIYNKISLLLTRQEIPRTQADFDNSYLYKAYILAFVINYTIPFYIAFFKGRFYTYPGDHEQYKHAAGIRADTCDASGCVVDLAINLSIIIVSKYIFGNIFEYICPILKAFYYKRRTFKRSFSRLPDYEQQYYLLPFHRYLFVEEYIEMMIQYGFVLFFLPTFPLAPFIAFLNNVLELRIDALKIVKYYRRPIPRRQEGIETWNTILQSVTYIGLILNGAIIAFTSQVVPREVYRWNHNGSLKGFSNSSFSVFAAKDFNRSETHSVDYCIYPSQRYPPDHPNKYQLTAEHWFILTMRFIVAIIIEHVTISFNLLISYMIPDVPYSIRSYLETTAR